MVTTNADELLKGCGVVMTVFKSKGDLYVCGENPHPLVKYCEACRIRIAQPPEDVK